MNSKQKILFLVYITQTCKWLLKCAPVQSDCKILWSSISLEGNSLCFRFLYGYFYCSKKSLYLRVLRLVGCDQVCLSMPRLVKTCQEVTLVGPEVV